MSFFEALTLSVAIVAFVIAAVSFVVAFTTACRPGYWKKK